MRSQSSLEISVIIICLVAALLGISINTPSGFTVFNPTEYLDCGHNEFCFLNGLNDCDKNYYTSIDSGDEKLSFIENKNQSHCQVNITITKSSDIKTENKSALCFLPKGSYTSQEYEEKIDNEYSNCIGSLPELLSEVEEENNDDENEKKIHLSFEEIEPLNHSIYDLVFTNLTIKLNESFNKIESFEIRYKDINEEWISVDIHEISSNSYNNTFSTISRFSISDLEISSENNFFLTKTLVNLSGPSGSRLFDKELKIFLNKIEEVQFEEDLFEPDNQLENLTREMIITTDGNAIYRTFHSEDDSDLNYFEVEEDMVYIITVDFLQQGMDSKLEIYDYNNDMLHESEKSITRFEGYEGNNVTLRIINQGEVGDYFLDVMPFYLNLPDDEDETENDSENQTEINESEDLPACNDGIDNDNDGYIDFDGVNGTYQGDPGCENETDDSEYNYVRDETSIDDENETDMEEHSDTCVEQWNCDEWTECQNGISRRTCIDMNYCGTETSKPDEITGCRPIEQETQEGSSDSEINELCTNKIKDKGEQGVDCGGICPPCSREQIEQEERETQTLRIESPTDDEFGNGKIILIIIVVLVLIGLGGGGFFLIQKMQIFNGTNHNSSSEYTHEVKTNQNLINNNNNYNYKNNQQNTNNPYNNYYNQNFNNQQIQNLKTYIAKMLRSGYSDANIRSALKNQGWSEQLISQAFNEYYNWARLQHYINKRN